MSLSFFNCQRTYFRICSSFKPTVLTQYPLAQKCLLQYRCFNSACRSNTLIALFPFKYLTTSDKIQNRYFGHQTKRRLYSQTACAKFLKLLIEYLLLSFGIIQQNLRRYSIFSSHFLNHYTTPLSVAWTISKDDGLKKQFKSQ